MSKYSEMMGSFIRGGNFPMEADYIFATEEALKEFYNDPVNNAILHKGLLKIVENDGNGNQALYWVTKKQTNDELEFTKLIVGTDINSIYDQLQTLQESLNKEIEDRKEADTAIWGTNDPTSVADDLNSINDLANAVTQIKEDIEGLRNTDGTLKTELQATVGTLDTDIVEYLKTLPYQSLTGTANALNKFLNTYNEETTKIDTLPQLLYFLDGYTDTDKLSDLLTDLWNKIEGSQLPSDDFQTLRDIEIFVKNLAQWSKDRTNNLQTEIDQTQIGVGLSGDGSYSPDKETYYLQDATSVMNALKILDGLMHQAISGITIGVENKDVVDLSVRKELEGYIISAFLKLSNALGNDLIKKEDGLFINIESEYDSGTLTLKVNGNVVAQHILGFSALVDSAKYDPEQESINIVFKLLNGDKQTVVIPVGALIREWEVDNEYPDRVVELYREEVIGEGADKLSADIRLSAKQHNILVKDGNTLLVEGTSDNITHNDQTLNQVIQGLQQEDSSTNQSLQSEIERAKAAEQAISQTVTDETNRAKLAEQEISNNLVNEVNRATTKENQLQENITSNQQAIADEVTRATNAETQIQSNLTDEIARAKAQETAISQELATHVNKTDNPHKVTKEQVGLDKVNNTSDLEKPISTATQNALNDLSSTIQGVNTELTNHVGNKLNPHQVTKEQVGLGNVDNTSDLKKPISDATKQALDQKVDATTFTEELNKKAPINNPIFTGIPQVETSPDPEDASQRIPSTDWVRGRIQESIGDMGDTLTAHINNLSNPHRVTADQVGTYDKSDIDDKLDKKADLVDGKIPADQLPASTIQWIEVE